LESWEEFEKYNGNEDTYTEILRTIRSIAARYSFNAPIFVADNKISILNILKLNKI
jgi:hypothetical protein